MKDHRPSRSPPRDPEFQKTCLEMEGVYGAQLTGHEKIEGLPPKSAVQGEPDQCPVKVAGQSKASSVMGKVAKVLGDFGSRVVLINHQHPPTPLPEGSSRWRRLRHIWRCPPHGTASSLLTRTVLGISFWAICAIILGPIALPPDGTIFWLTCMVGLSLLVGAAFERVKLPPLLGMLLVGMGLKNLAWRVHPDQWWDSFSSTLRGIALVVILMRAGLGLDPHALRRLSGMVLRLAFVPCLVETAVVGLASHFLMGLPWLWSFLLGFVLAAVSPAVVVPCLLEIQTLGYGVSKGVPTLVIAAASLDDVLAISGFSVLLGIIFRQAGDEGNVAGIVLQGPKEVLVGVVAGLFWGTICGLVPNGRETGQFRLVLLRSAVLLSGGCLALFGSRLESVNLAGSGALSVLVMSFVAGCAWNRQREWSRREAAVGGAPDAGSSRNETSPGYEDPSAVSEVLAVLWVLFQPLLFALIGSEIRLDSLTAGAVGWGLTVLTLGLTARLVASFLAICGGRLSSKEKVFVSLAWLPKATVQAAIGGLALDAASSSDGDGSSLQQEWALQVLTMAVLAILVTAPLGAIAIRLTYQRLLTKDQEHDAAKGHPDQEHGAGIPGEDEEAPLDENDHTMT